MIFATKIKSERIRVPKLLPKLMNNLASEVIFRFRQYRFGDVFSFGQRGDTKFTFFDLLSGLGRQGAHITDSSAFFVA